MTATSLQFGPEWMRTKQQTAPSIARPPNSVLTPASQSLAPSVPPGASSYSSLLTSPAPAPAEKQDTVNPFMYSKDEMLQVWKDGGGRGGLGLEVELWEGVVKEIGGEPIGLREMSEAERKLFSLPLNSELRRRQSHDFLPSLSLVTGDRPKHPHSASSTHNPLTQQRYGGLGNRRRKDEDSGQPLTVPRRLSMSSVASQHGGPLSPTAGALPSPRARLGSGSHGHDAIPSMGDGSWRKREPDVPRPGVHLGGGQEFDEREEETERQKTQSPNVYSNVSSKDLDISRSMSDRSMAPSPPSVRGASGQASLDELTSKFGDIALGDDQRHTTAISGTLDAPPTQGRMEGPRPPGIDEDLTNVSWSYRDPKGNIQGPFTATLMQKWYDDGYFTPDLLMKRTHLDTDWTPVGELCVRAGNEKLFFSSFMDRGPPGLSRSAIQSVDGQYIDRFGQPIILTMPTQPQHSSSERPASGSSMHPFRNPAANRSQTIDSHIGTTSSNSSDSPASAFSSSIGPVPSVSPDPPFGVGGSRSTFGNNGPEPMFGGHSQPSPLAPRGVSTAFSTTNDVSYGPRLASLGHRGPLFDNHGFTNPIASSNTVPAWNTSSGGSVARNADTPGLSNAHTQRPSLNNGAFVHSPIANVPGFNGVGSNDLPIFASDGYNYNTGFSQLGRGGPSAETLSSSFGPIGPSFGSRDQSLRQHPDLDGVDHNIRNNIDENSRAHGNFAIGHRSTTPALHTQNQYGPSMIGQQTNQQHNQVPMQLISPVTAFNQSPTLASPHAGLHPQVSQPQLIHNASVTQPPWGAPEASAQPRPRPFDAPHPTSRNVVRTPVTPNDTPFSNEQQQNTDWYTPPKGEPNESWGEVPATQTPENNQSGDANQGQQSGWNVPSPASFDKVVENVQVLPSNPTPPSIQPAQPQAREPTPLAAPKKRASGPAPQAQPPPPTKPVPTVLGGTPKPPSPQPPTPMQTKPAWSTSARTDEEVRPNKQAGLGLREIQEAEAKRVEAKRIADREKERVARAQPQEETQTFTASWGLPTSQAGTARPTTKEQISATSPSATPTPVWTNTGKPLQTKRTMKEILEEEERRKKLAARDKETAAATARRAYAESANKTPSAASSGGAWTTVGSGGKTNPSPSPVTRSIPGSSQVTTPPPTTVRSPNGAPSARTPSTSPQNVKPSASKPPPPDDGPVPPSPEFMKWLREAVRGFNPGFNTEEFMAMLLTFSLDFPPSTVEVIQDMVYMNSATLDGRRFAADFCSKRKADAANRPKGWGASAGGKTPSLAEVVKTQPKPAQAEFGFKMVKKKGRGNALR